MCLQSGQQTPCETWSWLLLVKLQTISHFSIFLYSIFIQLIGSPTLGLHSPYLVLGLNCKFPFITKAALYLREKKLKLTHGTIPSFYFNVFNNLAEERHFMSNCTPWTWGFKEKSIFFQKTVTFGLCLIWTFEWVFQCFLGSV